MLIGGTGPDLTNRPGFYSGFEAGDTTGVSGLHGCYSRPPDGIDDVPIALVLPGPMTIRRGNPEANVDNLKLLILVSRDDVASEWPTLTPFRDSVPAAFRAHMTVATVAGAVSLTPAITEATVTAGKPGPMKWGGTDYLGWEMVITVRRDPFGVLYTA